MASQNMFSRLRQMRLTELKIIEDRIHSMILDVEAAPMWREVDIAYDQLGDTEPSHSIVRVLGGEFVFQYRRNRRHGGSPGRFAGLPAIGSVRAPEAVMA
jgi:hypothetical protein